MVLKTIVIFMVFAVLLEDSASIKKTAEEEKEDEEVAKAVNRTLAEEKRQEDEEKKKRQDQEKRRKGTGQEDGDKKVSVEKQEGQDEACPPANYTCPVVEPCPADKECDPCGPCPEVRQCPPCKECGTCPPIECGPCPEERPCRPCKDCGRCPEVKPCQPCTVVNNTSPAPSVCPGDSGLTLPAAVAIGAVAGILVTGIATTVGLILRYVPPVASGFIFVATIILVWYLCSQYPETARELGGRAVAILREAAVALGHRVMAAIQRHQEQVGVP
jgi:hypothetical protein